MNAGDDNPPASPPAAQHGEPDRVWFRYAVIALTAATYAVTWPLWKARGDLPNLPVRLLEHVPQIDVGWLLLAALGLAAWLPRWGAAVYSVLLALAIGLDQCRLQPQYISLAILLWASLPSRRAALIGRAHLIALWFFAGLHKLLSQGYWDGVGARTLRSAMPWLSDDLSQAGAIAVALIEITIAVALLCPPLRRGVGWFVLMFHVGVFLSLSPLGANWNSAVWAWNVALGLAGPALLVGWRASPVADARRAGPIATGAAAVLLVSPALFYVGMLDAYLAHCLYSGNTASAVLIDAAPPPDATNKEVFNWQSSQQRLSHDIALPRLNTPFPPAHRLFEQYYRRVRRPGLEMTITDPRRWARRRGLHDRRLTFDGEFRGGVRHGAWVLRNDEGQVEARGRYHMGRMNGRWRQWDARGNLVIETHFRDDEKHGPHREWTPTGQLAVEGEYRHDKRHGRWVFYTSEGLARTVEYQDGQIVADSG